MQRRWVGLFILVFLWGVSSVVFEGCSKTNTNEKVSEKIDDTEKTTPKDGGTPKDTDTPKDTVDPDTVNHEDAGVQDQKPDETRSCASDLGKQQNLEVCKGKKDGDECSAERDCSTYDGTKLKGTCQAGICVPTPSKDAVDRKGGKPDLSCLTTPPTPGKGPDKATLWGHVEVFGLNKETLNIKVEIFDYEKDPDLKNPLGSDTTKAPKDTGNCSPACGNDRLCLNKVCVKPRDSDSNEIGFFEIKDIPTNKLFVLKTSGSEFVPTIQYLLWIPADEVVDGYYRNDAFTVSTFSKNVIAASAGVSSILPGNAVIAGEIHDCKGYGLTSARVSLDVLPQKLTYFDDGGQPDPRAIETSKDGIYAALNIKPQGTGDFNIRALINVGGKATLVGKFKAKLFPDAVIIMTTRPWYPGIK